MPVNRRNMGFGCAFVSAKRISTRTCLYGQARRNRLIECNCSFVQPLLELYIIAKMLFDIKRIGHFNSYTRKTLIAFREAEDSAAY